MDVVSNIYFQLTVPGLAPTPTESQLTSLPDNGRQISAFPLDFDPVQILGTQNFVLATFLSNRNFGDWSYWTIG